MSGLKEVVSLLIFSFISFIPFSLYCQEFKLAMPNVQFDSLLFQSNSTLELDFDLEGSSIYYSVGSSSQETTEMPYDAPIEITKDCTITYFTDHPDFLRSDKGKIQFFNVSNAKAISNLRYAPTTHERYTGSGEITLNDFELGSMNFQDGNWLGFQGKDVFIEIELDAPIEEGEFLIGIMQNAGAWIFGPEKVTLSAYSSDTRRYSDIENLPIKNIGQTDLPQRLTLPLSFELEGETSKFKLTFHSYKSIPDWHPGNKDNVWIFIDEIIVR